MGHRVSVIIPVYNVEHYIVECLRSVSAQATGADIECIIVDDKGTDKSIHIAEEYVATYKDCTKVDFRIIYRERNGGLSAARNTGIKAATGEYLYFLDSDDTIVPQCIETLLNIADKHGGVDLLPALYIRGNNDMEQFGCHSFPEFSDNRSLIKRSLLDYDKIPVTAANRLIRRELITENNLFFKEGIIHEDNYWTFFLAKYVQRMAFCAEKLYYYRETCGSITTAKNREKEIKAYSTIVNDFIDNIDDFESGAQKRTILLYLLIIKDNKYYKSQYDFDKLNIRFNNYNNFIELLLLKIIFKLPINSFFYKKTLNILQKIYLK
ncbi:MAG: glycosyltransferase [Prevotella sp.]|nr:glycosyltransferase [Prevotella sp.]